MMMEEDPGGGSGGRAPSANNGPSVDDGAGADSELSHASSSPASSSSASSSPASTNSKQPGQTAAVPVMAERDCRNSGRVERICSNAPLSRNHTQHHRHEQQSSNSSTTSETRNRHRERNSTPSSGSVARNRAGASAVAAAAAAAATSSQGGSAETESPAEGRSTGQADESGEISTEPNWLSPIKLTDFSTLFTVEDVQSAVSTTHNWQATKSSIKERLCFMFGNELMADVYFLVGRGSQVQRIPAHKFVLSISSAVFDAMFNGGMATNSAEVELPDVEPAAFVCMLRFLYTDEVRIGPETVMQCLYTAKKYAVVALERACVEFLKRNLCSDNAFMLLTQARLFDEPQLAALCLEMIDKATSEALMADGFTDIDLDTLCTVLERDTLGIKECKLFNAVCRWTQAECIRRHLPVTGENQRLVLGSRALELIRFPLMSVEEFAVGPAQSGVLTDREIVELFLHFTVTPKPSVRFSDVPRCCLMGKEQVISRFSQIETRWGYSGTSDRIRFMVNRKVFVVGFGLYGSIHTAAEYAVSIHIIHTDSGHTLGSNDSSFISDGSKSTFRVMFKEPVEIQPNTSYTACATLKGPDSYYGTKGLRKVAYESVSNGKVTFQFTYAAGNNNGTSVEDGQLPEIVFYT